MIEIQHKGRPVYFKVKGKWWARIGRVFPPLASFWTTTLNSVWVPPQRADVLKQPERLLHYSVVRHELIHVDQWRSLGLLFWIGYLLAYFRWRFERVAYMEQIKTGEMTPRQVADILWSAYLWPWPRKWMEKWFEAKLRELTL